MPDKLQKNSAGQQNLTALNAALQGECHGWFETHVAREKSFASIPSSELKEQGPCLALNFMSFIVLKKIFSLRNI
jgi:hypothetical protein